MRRFATEPKLMALVTAIVLVTAIRGVGSYIVLARVNKSFQVAVNSTARKLQLAADINIASGEMLAAQRGILLYANTPEAETNVQIFQQRSRQIQHDIEELEKLSPDPKEQEAIRVVEENNAVYGQVVQQLASQDAFDLADRRKVALAYKSIDESTDRLQVLESGHLRDGLAATQASIRHGRIALLAIATFGFVVVVFALKTVHEMGKTLRDAAKELSVSHEFLKSVVNSLPCAVCIFDADGNLKRWNNNFLGYSFEEMKKTGVLASIEPESLEAVKATLVKTLATGFAETEANIRARDGRKIPVYLTHRRFMYEGQACILGVGIDISKQKKAEQFSRLQRVALESASQGIVITDATGAIEWANPAFTTLTGYELEEVLGVNPRLLKSGMMDRAFYKDLWATILDGRPWSGELWNLKKNGDVYCEEMHIAPVRAVDSTISNFVAVKHDITERKQAEAESERAKEGLVLLNKELREANETIFKISQTDPLTGLANRRTMDERMRLEMARAERLGCGFSVILADLDHFKAINDDFGHLVGDRVLVGAAEAFARQARPYDLPARFGGEEFLVLLPESTLSDAMTIAQRIRAAISKVTVPEVTRPVTISLGISTWGPGDTAGALVGRADAALYQAKRRGRNRVVAQTCDMPPTISVHLHAGEADAELVQTA